MKPDRRDTVTQSKAETPTSDGQARDVVSTRVAMMVWNTCENDSRVIKEATSLVSAGYSVTVVCLAAPALPDVARRSGVTYQRVSRVFGPIRERVDLILNLVGLSVFAVAGAAVVAAIAAVGWLLGRSGAGPAQFSVAAVLLFGLGAAAGALIKPRRVIAVARRWRSRMPLRMRLLTGLYRILTFRLVLLTMGDAVTALSPDVIHAHDLQTLPAAAKLATRLGATLVYDSHELATHVSTRPPLPMRLWMKWKERRSIPHAARVITVSSGIAEHLERRYGLASPVATIFNSPPTITGRSTSSDVRADLGLSESVPLALYVGALTANRGLEQTVDALGLLPEFHLACVGPRRADWEMDMHARAKAGGFDHRIHFMDPVPIEELTGYLSTADVGVIAIQNISLSYWFTMPNKLFETVLAGVPVVVADLPHLRDFAREHAVGVVADEKDPASLAKAIREVMSRPELRPTGERLERLREEFGWEAQARRLVALYDELVTVRASTG